MIGPSPTECSCRQVTILFCGRNETTKIEQAMSESAERSRLLSDAFSGADDHQVFC
jgi:hypothetical protein